jgi:hypothetical protein
MQRFNKEIYCPNCEKQLEIAPSEWKEKCPYCGNWIYVNKGELITEDKFHYLYWMMYLPNLGITEQIFEAYRDKLTKKFKTISVRDTVWYILNFMVGNYPFSEYSMLAYYELARMAAMEQRDAQEYIELMLRTQLVINKIKKVKTVRVVCYGDDPEQADCPMCARLHHKKFSVDEALEKMPIPRQCTSGFCTCEYDH